MNLPSKMKLQKSLIVLLVALAVTLGVRQACAQAPAASADPAVTAETTVYLKHEYTKALETDKLFDSDKFVAQFVGFEAEFAVFKQRGSTESIYIPKTAILYMRRPLVKGPGPY